jgi:periplasmic protein TonB
MLRTLLESDARRERRRASTAVSVAVHTIAIVGAIVATASATTDQPSSERGLERPPLYVPLPPRTDRPREPSSSKPAPRVERALVESVLRPLSAPVFVPRWVDRPPAEIDPKALLAADTGILGRQASFGEPPSGRLPGPPPSDGPATAGDVDRPAALLAPPRPRYPEQLRVAGVTGRVVVRLVVDTMGRVEPASISIRESSHDLFAQAVRAVLTTLRFTPAVAGGRKVRMLVDLPFDFRLND